MKKLATAILTTMIATSASAISYNDLVSKGKISAVATTLGAGVEYSYSVSDKVAARVGYYSASMDFDLAATGTTPEEVGEFTMQSMAVIGDYHPGAGMFRLSAGLINMTNKMTTTFDADVNQEVGDTTYVASDILSGSSSLEIGGTLPYFGIGLAKSPSADGLGANLDIGVAISPEVSVSVDVQCVDTAVCSTLQADIDAEVAEMLGDQNLELPFWPVLSAGVSYSF